MPATLNHSDMMATRNFVRWAAIGTQPSAEVASSVMDILKSVGVQSGSMLRRVTEEVVRGVLPSQENCKAALAQLKQMVDGTPDADVEKGEIHRG